MTEEKNFSDLNEELFLNAKRIFDDNNGGCHHMGWCDVSEYINWLENNYDIKKKDQLDQHADRQRRLEQDININMR